MNASRRLREKVVDDPDLIDAAVIFGTGFAPFRGGPLAYARSRGPAEVVAGSRSSPRDTVRVFAPMRDGTC